MPIRRKGNRWEVRVGAGGGRRIEQRLPAGATRNDAQALEVALRRRLVETATGRVDYSLAEAFDRWEIEARRLKSWEKDVRYRAAVLRELAGSRKLSQLVDVADMVKAKGTEAKLSAAAINRYLAILKRIGALAFKWEWTPAPIAARIELLAGERRRTTFATERQLRDLVDQADPRIRGLLQLSVLTGLRRGELLGLTKDNLVDGAIVLGSDTKTGAPRLVPLTPQAKAIAEKAIPAAVGAPLLRKLYEEARDRAGLPGLRWHDLRRTFGTWLIQGGANLAQVRDLLGHGDVKTTSIYLATARQDLKDAVRLLPKLHGERAGKKRRATSAKKAA